ncbi:MAG: 1-deoxy-D-xylulose-5-phosphate reductoisomerase [Oscillospiraceae bacterium]|nr:1-deoxy-D-xylulose-5-phosphate reductoisomerase [Oscillospiraceae bacterium]
MIRSVSVLGSTGSIGRQSLDAAERLGIRVAALAAQRSVKLLEEQIRRFRPRFAAVYDAQAAKELKIAVRDMDVTIGDGMSGLRAAAVYDCEGVVTAVSGSVGLRPTLDAIAAKKRICLANKETLVCAGQLVMQAAAEQGAEILPVDSEHSAIFQCLEGRKSQLHKILLTGSGGPFRGWTRAQTASVTPEQAVRHPNWHMGAKISVDSATMMNKGLEFIEAMHLFSVTPEDIQVVVHPQSVIHSMVELNDGTVLAQLAVPDMGLPIQYAMTWPERSASPYQRLDFWQMKDMTFEAPDLENTPCLALAMDCARQGGLAPAVMSAANEAAVSLFLHGKIGYNEIYDRVAAAVQAAPVMAEPGLEDILAADGQAREKVLEGLQ